MSTYERREQIRRRLMQDPALTAILATARSRSALPPGVKPEVHPLMTEVITAGISPTTIETAAAPNQSALMTGFHGRLVRAEEANLNGAYFAKEDLQYGLPSLHGAPVTWNHETAAGAYGMIQGASLETTPDFGPHIWIDGGLWTARFPEFTDSLLTSIDNGSAAMSMECMASAIQCMISDCGCVATDPSEACQHLLDRTGPRRMVMPTFYGAGLILDGIKPGWPDASLGIVSMRESAAPIPEPLA